MYIKNIFINKYRENVCEINSEYSNEIISLLREFNENQGKSSNNYLINQTQIFLRNILQKNNLIVVGRASSYKSTLIKICAHIYSELMSKINK